MNRNATARSLDGLVAAGALAPERAAGGAGGGVVLDGLKAFLPRHDQALEGVQPARAPFNAD